jgi:hypothetical protein
MNFSRSHSNHIIGSAVVGVFTNNCIAGRLKVVDENTNNGVFC